MSNLMVVACGLYEVAEITISYTSFVSTDKPGTFNNMPKCSVSCLHLRYEENDIVDSTVFDHTHDRNIGIVEVNIPTGKKF